MTVWLKLAIFPQKLPKLLHAQTWPVEMFTLFHNQFCGTAPAHAHMLISCIRVHAFILVVVCMSVYDLISSIVIAWLVGWSVCVCVCACVDSSSLFQLQLLLAVCGGII